MSTGSPQIRQASENIAITTTAGETGLPPCQSRGRSPRAQTDPQQSVCSPIQRGSNDVQGSRSPRHISMRPLPSWRNATGRGSISRTQCSPGDDATIRQTPQGCRPLRHSRDRETVPAISSGPQATLNTTSARACGSESRTRETLNTAEERHRLQPAGPRPCSSPGSMNVLRGECLAGFNQLLR